MLVAYFLFMKDKKDVPTIYKQLKAVQNDKFEVYKTTNVPAKYHFSAKDDRYGRLGEIILIAHAPNYFSNRNAPKGSHGFFVKETPEMKATFMAWGPDFVNGKVIKPFSNVQIYPMLAQLLGLPITEKIDGTKQLANKILKK